jgi:hypothetical protein
LIRITVFGATPNRLAISRTPGRPGAASAFLMRSSVSGVSETKVLAVHHAPAGSAPDRFSTPVVLTMELFNKLFGNLLAFVYHCFHRIVIHGYLGALSRPEQVVYFFRQVLGVPVVSKEILSQRTADYQPWVEAFARNHHTPIVWAEKGVRKEDHVVVVRKGLTTLRMQNYSECQTS